MPVHDRLGRRQSGPVQQVTPVRPVHTDRSDRSHQKPGQAPVPRLMDVDTSVDVPSQKPVMSNDHEAGSSKGAADKYHQPRWCPSGLTHTQKRKLQRLRNKEKKEQEKEKMRDEEFNRYRPMFPQSKVWKAKAADQPDRPVGSSQPTGQTGHEDRSDRSDQPVKPVEPTAEPAAESAPPVSVTSVDEAPAVPLTAED